MSHAAAVEQTGDWKPNVSNSKFAIWLFLATEIMFFTALIGVFVVLRIGAPAWPNQQAVLNRNIGGFNTLVLIASSVTMVFAHAAMMKGEIRRMALFLGITTALGLAFMGIKAT